MINRFQGDENQRVRLEKLLSQKLVAGNQSLAKEIEALVELKSIPCNETLIEQDGTDNDIYFVLTGSFKIEVNGTAIGKRVPNDHIGEMAAIEPSQKRVASVIALEDSVVAKLTEPHFAELGNKYPDIYKKIAQELSLRLQQRNKLVTAFRDKIKVFIICSVEALPIAEAIQNAFEYEPFLTTIWSNGVFKVTNYTLQSLEDEVDDSDFAIAIAHADDLLKFRGQEWPSSRDNVIFELGLFMGRLGRSRAILMEPREESVKLPSDLAGVTTIPYCFPTNGNEVAPKMGPACNKLKEHIKKLGPNN
jgi:CRP/FNR family cyclic AMP-dependent transcriptional regulator